MNNSTPRPTPDPIKHQLRQEAGFGCCKCGHPILQYHHIVPFSVEQHFRSEDMMVLCPNCHDEVTQGAMAEKEQRRYKSRPHNIKRGYVQGMLRINDNQLVVRIGNNFFVGGGSIIQVDDIDLIRLDVNSKGSLELTLYLYDEQDNLLVSIVRNEWISGNIALWDIEFKYRLLRVRKRKGSIDLTIDARKKPTDIRANMWRKGHLIFADTNILRVDRQEMDSGFAGCTFSNSFINFRTQPNVQLEIKQTVFR